MIRHCGHSDNEFCGFDCYGVSPIEWKHIGEWIGEDSKLYHSYPLVDYSPDKPNEIILDVLFTIDQLIELGEYLKLKKQQEVLKDNND